MCYRYVIRDEDGQETTSDQTYETPQAAWYAAQAATPQFKSEFFVTDKAGKEIEWENIWHDIDPMDPDGGDARDIQREAQRWRDIAELGYIRPEHEEPR